MRWEDERYVRVYTRDTLTWRLLGFHGRVILLLLLRKVDRAGILEIGDTPVSEALSIMLEAPIDVVESGLKSILATGAVVAEAGRLVVPNFIEAQEARASDAARQRKHREMARVTQRDAVQANGHDRSHAVTRGHTESHAVTPSCAVPSCAVPSQEKEQEQKIPASKSPVTAGTWQAYSAAYHARYGAVPVRNATVNGQLAQLVKRLGESEAPEVAAFYLAHNGSFYVSKGHSVGVLLADCEKIRTEWATGRQITTSAARSQDKTQANVDGWMSLARSKHGVG